MPESSALAYKAYEIEEFVDIYFYRRLGYVVACAARRVHLTPNAVTVLAGGIGAAGGALIAWPHLAWAGIALLVVHGVVDSADGQLARMTGQTSELGRILDGVAGYLTHIAIYGAIFAILRREGAGALALGLAVLSAVFTAVHAQLYDYYRTAYAAFAIKGRTPTELQPPPAAGALGALVGVYATSQRALLGLQGEVERVIAARAAGGPIRDDDRQRYRRYFYGPVCGWNLLGDNVRRYAIAACVALQHPEWFIVFTLGPMNLVLLGLWVYQQSADRRFLAGPGAGSVRTRPT